MKNIQEIARIARLAGDAVMEIYNSGDFETEYKADDSPLTLADRAAHEIILRELQKQTTYPIVSE